MHSLQSIQQLPVPKKELILNPLQNVSMPSPPLVAYVVMFILAVANIDTPPVILTLIRHDGKGQHICCHADVRLLFHIEFKKEYMGEIFKLIGIRHIFAAVCAVIFYFVLPFDLVIRQTLVLLCFAPMSAVAPAYTGMCGGDEGMASCANSVSILCSLVVITALLAIMGLY